MLEYFNSRGDMVSQKLKPGMTGAKIGTTCFPFNETLLRTQPEKLYIIDLPGDNAYVFNNEHFLFKDNIPYDVGTFKIKDFPAAVFQRGKLQAEIQKIPDKSLDFIYIDTPFVVKYANAWDITIYDFFTYIQPKLKPGALVMGAYFNDGCIREAVIVLQYMLQKNVTAFTLETSQQNVSWLIDLSPSAGLKFKVAQFAIGDKPYYRLSEEISRLYCERHGYDYAIHKHRHPRTQKHDRHVMWEKIPTLREELKDCDYLFYIDSDAYFYTPSIRLEDLVFDMQPHVLIRAAKDVFSEAIRGNQWGINAGVLFIRNTEQAHNLLEIWDNSSDEYAHWRWGLWHEQSALNDIRCNVCPGKIEQYSEWHKFNGAYGLFVKHMMGMSDEMRTAMMEGALKRMEGMP